MTAPRPPRRGFFFPPGGPPSLFFACGPGLRPGFCCLGASAGLAFLGTPFVAAGFCFLSAAFGGADLSGLAFSAFDFTVLGFDTTWFGGASDDVDFVLYHHKATGWTYNAGAEPSPPEIVRMTDDYTTAEDETVSGEFLAWKRDNLSTFINGGDGEGLILSAISSKASAFQIGNTVVKLRA